MDVSHNCAACQAPLQADDGHDWCPSCLGFEHLTEALESNHCMNCSYMPHALRLARLAQLEPQVDGDLPSGQAPTTKHKQSKRHSDTGDLPSGQAPSTSKRKQPKRRSDTAADAGSRPAKKKSKSEDDRLASKVDKLSAELQRMTALLMVHQPQDPTEEARVPAPEMPYLEREPQGREEDTLSLAASASHFREYEEGEVDTASQVSDQYSSAQTEASEADDETMRAILRMALEKLKLTIPEQEGSAPTSKFFKRKPLSTAFAVPHAEDYVRELQSCWTDSKARSRLASDGRTLAAMHDSAAVGLECMPSVEPVVSSLVVSPDESLNRDTRCPRPQCRLTDDLLVRGYNAGARAGRIGNSLSHLLLALSSSLPEGSANTDATALCDASLEAFGLMTRELGRMMSIMVQARRQVWLSQSGLSERARRTLQGLPVVPGTVFGPAAQEALDRTIQAGQTRQQLVDLRRGTPANRPPRGRGRGYYPAALGAPPRPDYSRDQRPQRFARGQPRGRGQFSQFRVPDPVAPHNRAPRGRGGKY